MNIENKIKDYCTQNKVRVSDYVNNDKNFKNRILSLLNKTTSINKLTDAVYDDFDRTMGEIDIEFAKECCNYLKIPYNESNLYDILNVIEYEETFEDLALNIKIKCNILYDFDNDGESDFTTYDWVDSYLFTQDVDTENRKKIVDSITYEINESTSEVNIPTFSVLINIREYLELLNTYNKTIKILPNTSFGLFNPENGSGSDFNIIICKPFILNPLKIVGIQIDEENVDRRLKCGYTVNETYGFVDEFWKPAEVVNV